MPASVRCAGRPPIRSVDDTIPTTKTVRTMTWTETHERYRLLNEAEETLRRDPACSLPWSPAYAAVFSTPDRLAQALRHRWRTRFQAQLDPALPPADYEANFAYLLGQFAPLMGRIGTHEFREELAEVCS